MSDELREKLAACPFCGSAPMSYADDNHSTAHNIVCVRDNACAIHECEIWSRTEADAIAAWNRRVAPPPGGSGEGVELLDTYDALIRESYSLSGYSTRHGGGKVAPYKERALHAEKCRIIRKKVLAALSPAPALDDEGLALLRKHRDKFAFYAKSHEKKGTREGRSKAVTNWALAHEIDAYLAKQEPRT